MDGLRGFMKKWKPKAMEVFWKVEDGELVVFKRCAVSYCKVCENRLKGECYRTQKEAEASLITNPYDLDD